MGLLLPNQLGDLALNAQARFNTGAVCRGMACAELHWGLVGDSSGAAGERVLSAAATSNAWPCSCDCLVRPCPHDGPGQGEAQRGDANPDKCFALPG